MSTQAWRDAKHEKLKEYAKAYYQSNKETINRRSVERYKAWAKANPEEAKSRRKTWKRTDWAKYKDSAKAYREANKEKLYAANRLRVAAWRKANPDKAATTSRRYKQAEAEKLNSFKSASKSLAIFKAISNLTNETK